MNAQSVSESFWSEQSRANERCTTVSFLLKFFQKG
jgi:hypothetical protein